jgi:Family of unknown function (DUF5719)
MRRLPLAAAGAVIALVAVAVAGSVIGSTALPAPRPVITTAPVTSATLVCPDINGRAVNTVTRAAAADVATFLTPPSQSTGAVTSMALVGRKSKRTPLVLSPIAVVRSQPKLNPTIAIRGSGSVAASLVADLVTETSLGRERALAGVRCAAPATDWWFAGADGRVGFHDVLTLANPAPTAANVAISMWSAKGALPATSLQSVRVPATSTLRIGISSIAPDVATIAVHVHATSGAVTAAMVDRRTSALLSDGGDFMPATLAPARSAVVAGFAAGKGPRRLYLADPGPLAATVTLRLVTRSGSFTPAGDNQVVVRAGHTKVVTLDRAFAGTTGAVALTSDQPVVAQGMSRTSAPPHRPDLMWLAATAPLRGSTGIATGREPDGGRCFLLLSAPQGQAQVQITTPAGGSSTISVPAGHSVAVDITATIRVAPGQPGAASWPFVVTSTGSAPVYGMRMLTFSGAHGALVTGEPLVTLPAAIALPAVHADPRIAMR